MMINTVINLDGRWKGSGPKHAIISVSSSNLTINMSAFGRPSAFGMIQNTSNIIVTFPDDKTYTGKLEQPNTIRWSNNTVWTKVIDLVGRLQGFWKPIGSPDRDRANISVSSSNLTINMSAFGRPTAHGSILDDSTIRVTFPDDKTYTGKLDQPGKIRWSNNTVWTRVIVEG